MSKAINTFTPSEALPQSITARSRAATVIPLSGAVKDVGGIVGENYGTVKDCHTDGFIASLGLNPDYFGGIVGTNVGTVENCYHEGTLKPDNVQQYSSSDIGGIVGYNNGTVVNCYNKGAISGYNAVRVGGIVGTNYGSVEICYNQTKISLSGTENRILGGISAENHGSIENCYNKGDLKARYRVGGIVGTNVQTSATIKNCYNDAYEIKATDVTSSDNVVGAIASNNNGIIKNCYYRDGNFKDANGKDASGIGFEADIPGKTELKTDTQIHKGEVTYLLQSGVSVPEGETEAPLIWGQEINGSSTRPSFRSDRVYYGYRYTCGNCEKFYTNDSSVFPEKTGQCVINDNGLCSFCDRGGVPAT